LINAEMAKQAEMQERQRGQLLMQTFEQWAEQRDIPAEKMEEMRLEIAKEYGLISDEQAKMIETATDRWDEWADGFSTSAEETVNILDTEIKQVEKFGDTLAELPTSKVITVEVKYKVSGRPAEAPGARLETGLPSNVPGGQWQFGTGFAPGGLSLLGERGPELVSLPRGAQVMTNQQTRNITNNNQFTMNARFPGPQGIEMGFREMMALVQVQ